jgi:hypothetical protein
MHYAKHSIGNEKPYISSLFRRMNSVIGANDLEKFYAVQGLCIAFLLIGVVLPQWSFWKFPYLLVLGRNGQWFSVQYQDEQFEKAPQ